MALLPVQQNLNHLVQAHPVAQVQLEDRQLAAVVAAEELFPQGPQARRSAPRNPNHCPGHRRPPFADLRGACNMPFTIQGIEPEGGFLATDGIPCLNGAPWSKANVGIAGRAGKETDDH